MAVGFHFDASQITQAIDALAERAGRLEGPTRAASRATARLVRRDVSRRVRAATGASSAAMRRRFRLYDSYDRKTGAWAVRAWFGTRPLSPFEAGAKRIGRGVATKSERWPTAFIATMRGRSRVMRRYGTPRVIGGRLRQPLQTLRVPIHQHVQRAFALALPEARKTYVRVYMDKWRAELLRGASA